MVLRTLIPWGEANSYRVVDAITRPTDTWPCMEQVLGEYCGMSEWLNKWCSGTSDSFWPGPLLRGLNIRLIGWYFGQLVSTLSHSSLFLKLLTCVWGLYRIWERDKPQKLYFFAILSHSIPTPSPAEVIICVAKHRARPDESATRLNWRMLVISLPRIHTKS